MIFKFCDTKGNIVPYLTLSMKSNQNPNSENCQVCNSHLYSLYAGGAKERVKNMYYCNGCQKVIELQYEIIRSHENLIFNGNNEFKGWSENEAVNDLKNEIAINFNIEDGF